MKVFIIHGPYQSNVVLIKSKIVKFTAHILYIIQYRDEQWIRIKSLREAAAT